MNFLLDAVPGYVHLSSGAVLAVHFRGARFASSGAHVCFVRQDGIYEGAGENFDSVYLNREDVVHHGLMGMWCRRPPRAIQLKRRLGANPNTQGTTM
jgi:hypothetical protein